MIDLAKLKSARAEILLGRLNLAARLILESGAAGVELSLDGIEKAVRQAEAGTVQEAEGGFQEPAQAGGCSGCRGL